ncbi:MAG: hypothetical protein Q9180_006043 [Flavoplaca navasiana]
MHLPYIRHLLSLSSPPSSTKDEFEGLIPILIGNTTPSTERKYGNLLAPYLSDPENIFIVSSDFCHWGTRFGYTYYLPSTSTTSATDLSSGISLHPKTHKTPPTDPAIHDSIGTLDRACMEAIESGSHERFLKVLRETGNTVCGRHPIGVVMAGLEGVARDEVGKKEGGMDEGQRGKRGRFRFVRYERSSEVRRVGESSVSYASAFAIL